MDSIVAGTTQMIDEAYFIMAGGSKGAGCVLTRARGKCVDYWSINAPETKATSNPLPHRVLVRLTVCVLASWTRADLALRCQWYLLQTNYDHWNPVPKADDRRTPGIAHMDALGEDEIDSANLFRLMTQSPTYNDHTDYTAVMEPQSGLYRSGVWL